MKDLIIGKRAKFSLLAALLACALTAGLAVGADEAPPPADKATETAAPAPPAAPSHAAPHHGPRDFAKKRAKFLEDTRDLRRQIAMKEAAMQAQKRSAQPDVNLIQQFAGELFDLREQMRARAAENGLPPMMGGRMGHPGRGFMGHGGCMDWDAHHDIMGHHERRHCGAPDGRHGGHHGDMDCGCGGC